MAQLAQFSKAGYVLAGGRSSRMGSDKALLPFRGRTLVEHIAEQVRIAAGSVTLIGHSPIAELPAVPDRYPAFGPVGGIVTALEHSQAEWNLLIACDMPFLTADWLAAILDAAANSAGDAVIPVCEGRLHPLCAAYRRSALPALQHAVARGIHTVREAIEPLATVHLPVPDARLVANINTPEDWAHAKLGQE